MYKIYINNTPLFLISKEELPQRPNPDADNLVARYPGKAKFLLHYVDMLEKTDRFDSVTLYSEDLNKLWEDFRGHFKILEAAGGLVFNDDELLWIFRRGSWDLPKGKIDEGETIEEAALREVKEETGLENLRPERFFNTTYHTYRGKSNERILKPTHWYIMHTDQRELKPEHEEDIEFAEWMTIPEFLKKEREVFGNILDLVEGYGKL